MCASRRATRARHTRYTSVLMRGGSTVAQRFVIEREAGVGGMGRVYRARDRESGDVIALKVLSAVDTASRDRFEREARILHELSHPAIVRYVAHGEDGGLPFIAMEWLDGHTTFRRGCAAVRSAPGDAAKLGLCVAEALSCAHEAGVLHRDVKPSNLIMGDDDTHVRVVDFGVARHVREALAVTQNRLIVGSCAYMSPEQARGDRDVDPRSDLFSLGCVLYEVVSGIRAFGAPNATASLAKVLLDEPPPLHEVAPHVPHAYAAPRLQAPQEEPRRSSGERQGRGVDGAARPHRGPRPGSSRSPFESIARTARAASRVGGARLERHGRREHGDGPRRRRRDDGGRNVDDRAAPSGRALVRRGKLTFLADATAIATFSGGVPTDEAARAAQCALAMRDVLRSSSIAMALGRGEIGAWAPIGAVHRRGGRRARAYATGDPIRLAGRRDADWLVAYEGPGR